MTVEQLALLGGTLLSLLFSYVPGLSGWFDAKDKTIKRLIMAVLLLVVAGGALALSCANLANTGVACTQQGVMDLIGIYILALVANQSVYAISPHGAKAAK